MTRLCAGLAPGEALRQADLALYRAKDAGRGTVANYDEALEVEARRRLLLETLVRRGLEEGALVAHAQPIVRFATGEVVGYELLARFRDGDEEVLPEGLIAVAEESGLVTEIDTRMLHAAAELLLASPDAPLVVGVNMSVRTLLHPGLTEEVEALAAWTRGSAGRIAVELKEQALLHDVDGIAAALGSLRASGFLVGIDDYGTGFTSLSHLRRFPLDFVKLDGSLLADLDGGADSSAVCEALLDMAAALGLEVIAEGVETQGQATFLGRLGCPLAQGFHLGRPVPVPDAAVGSGGRLPIERSRRRRASARHRSSFRA